MLLEMVPESKVDDLAARLSPKAAAVLVGQAREDEGVLAEIAEAVEACLVAG
jgi:hypothetical protein